MSWTTLKAELVTALSGYTEYIIKDQSADLEDVPSTKIHKVYTLRLGEPDESLMVDKGTITSYHVQLKVRYKEGGGHTYDSNYDLFIALRNLIKAKSNYANSTNFTFTRLDDNINIGEFHFFYGFESC